MRHSRLHRTLTLVFALLHLLVPPLVAAADARLQRESLDAPRPVMHAESEGAPHCPRTHPVDCGLCHAISPLAVPARAEQALPTATASVAAIAAPAHQDCLMRSLRRCAQSRRAMLLECCWRVTARHPPAVTGGPSRSGAT